MPQTSLFCGWVCSRRACLDTRLSKHSSSPIFQVRWRSYASPSSQILHLVFIHREQTLQLYTHATPDTDTRRNTPSRVATCTSLTPTMLLRQKTLSRTTSTRVSLLSVLQPNPLTHVVLFTRIADLRPGVGIQVYARDSSPPAALPRGASCPPPQVCARRPASVVEHADGPIPFDAPRIVYSEEDERALEEFARANGA